MQLKLYDSPLLMEGVYLGPYEMVPEIIVCEEQD